MKLSLKTLSVTLLSLLPSADAFTSSGSSNVVLYWGQASAGSQESLGTYCKSTNADVYVLSFLSDFPQSRLSIHGCSGTLDVSCPDVAEDIKLCQSLGKKVLLSLGGAAGTYGFSSDQQAINFASTLWNSFGGGKSTQRPFGTAVLDGFDLDIENGDPTGYTALTTALKKLYAGGEYYIAAAPQCVYPDSSLSTALANGYFDFVFIQFYNNKCQLDGSFNWATWEEYAAEYAASTNPNIKLFLGLPGSTSAASSGYSSVSTVQTVLSSIRLSKFFGGIMLWDASQAASNVVNGVSYVSALKSLLTSSGSSDDTAAAVSISSKKPLVVSSAAAVNEWDAPIATSSVVYNEWGYPVVVTPSSSPVAASTVVYNEWGYPVVVTPSSSPVATATVVYNEWGNPVVAAPSSSVADTWNAPVSSIVSEWSSAPAETIQAWSAASPINEVIATTVVADAAIESPATQWSESNSNSGLWNPNAPVNPDNGYWTPGKYEGKIVNKLAVAELPSKKEQDSATTASTSAALNSKTSSVADSTGSKSTAVFLSFSDVASIVSSTSDVSSIVPSSEASSSVVSTVPGSSSSVTATLVPTSSSFVAISSLSSAVEFTSSSAASIDAAIESTPSKDFSSSFVSKNTFLSSFTTIRSAAPADSSLASTTETFVTTITSVASSALETVVSDTTETVQTSTSVIESAAAAESVTVTDNSLSASKSVTKSLKLVEPESVPQKCHDDSQGHIDSCLNTLFETEIKPVELNTKDITDSDVSAALPAVGEITQMTSSVSDEKQDSDELSCTKEGAVTCKDGKFAMCNFNKWVLFSCPPSTTCKALTINDIETVVGCNFI
ncbi:hypothetical protein D0Z03_000909 [Geotrichum reessii]|nr:hypothetical protein D0Z03_000909 [Galactomyces reessii]